MTHPDSSAIQDVPGVYVLLLRLDHAATVTARGGRQFALDAALYAYVGSARGPGGLVARIGRHRRRAKRCHWHVDFALAHAAATGAVCFGAALGECQLATIVGESAGATPVPHFGNSGCRCRTHLYALPQESGPEALAAALRPLAVAAGLPYPLLAVVPIGAASACRRRHAKRPRGDAPGPRLGRRCSR